MLNGKIWETPPGFGLETDLPILWGMPALPHARYPDLGHHVIKRPKMDKNPEALQRNV